MKQGVRKQMKKRTKTKLKKNLVIFYKNGGISAGIENILAMLPSTILMPIIINNGAKMTVFDVSCVLFAAGLGTLIFMLISKGGTPSFLGSSFAFIGVTVSICRTLIAEGKQSDISSYLFGTYLFSAFLLIILSTLCKINEKKAHSIIETLVPAAVMGPVISLIGLELSPQAVERAGLLEEHLGMNALFSISLIVLFICLSFMKKKLFKNASLFVSFICVCILYTGYMVINKKWCIDEIISNCFEMRKLSFPDINIRNYPKFHMSYMIMIIPPTFILFCEHIARKMMVENLKESLNDKNENPTLSRSVFANSVSNITSALFSGVPLTLYAENIAVMRINSYSKRGQFILSSILVMLLSFCGPVLHMIQRIPDPIIGGMSLVLMGVIAVPGLKMLIDRSVDYNNISNLLLTSAVLITGLSKMKITILKTEFSGMSLGLLVGIVLNIFICLITRLGLNKDIITAKNIENIITAMGLKDVKKLERNEETYSEISFYYKEADNRNLFISVTENFDKKFIIAATGYGKEKCLSLYKTVLYNDKYINIESARIHNDKMLENLIKNAYTRIKSDVERSDSKVRL